ncbi:MAG: heavy-metal-associated domain-containing protein [Clostridiales bacterium]|jgi:copper chaperone CopZ|nr:heavy-metal-associated domain-containing protein [Clostridiales bacterium]
MSISSAYFTIGNLENRHDVKALKRELDKLAGVISVSASTRAVAVDYDPTGVGRERIQKQIERMGFVVSNERRE